LPAKKKNLLNEIEDRYEYIESFSTEQSREQGMAKCVTAVVRPLWNESSWWSLINKFHHDLSSLI
jgi:hypothetical protein